MSCNQIIVFFFLSGTSDNFLHPINPIRRYIAAKFITKITLNQRIINNCSVFFKFPNTKLHSMNRFYYTSIRRNDIEKYEEHMAPPLESTSNKLRQSKRGRGEERKRSSTSFKNTLSTQYLHHYRKNCLFNICYNIFRIGQMTFALFQLNFD